MAKRWYIVHAYSNFEHRVKAALEERIKRYGIEDKFGETVTEEEIHEMYEDEDYESEFEENMEEDTKHKDDGIEEGFVDID